MAGIGRWPIAVALISAGASGASAQTALSFDAAQARYDRSSHTISAADHGVEAARAAADAVRTLHRPIVTASVQYLEYQKSLSVDVSGPKATTLGNTQTFLAALPASVPPAYQQIAADISGRLSQALPGLFNAIPDQLSYRFRDDVLRPTVQGALPLYTGGAIPAIQRAAQGGVAMAEGRRAQALNLARIDLIRAYFGQQAAAELLESARRSRDALDAVLSDSRKLEAAGVIPHARTLEVEVARDTAERVYQRADLSYASARDDLARLPDLETGGAPTTALFVQTRPLSPAQAFLCK